MCNCSVPIYLVVSLFLLCPKFILFWGNVSSPRSQLSSGRSRLRKTNVFRNCRLRGMEKLKVEGKRHVVGPRGSAMKNPGEKSPGGMVRRDVIARPTVLGSLVKI